MRIAAIVVAGGAGRRLGNQLPKALVSLNGRPLYEWAAVAMSGHPAVSRTVVVGPQDACPEMERALAGVATVVAGGTTRQESVLRGLTAIGAAGDVDAVLVHDAARPLVPSSVVDNVVNELLAGADAVIPVIAVADTIKRVDAAGVVVETLARDQLRAVQTPQGFRRELLDSAHREAAAGRTPAGRDLSGVTDDAGLLELLGVRIHSVPGSELSFKITTQHDLDVAQALVSSGAAVGVASPGAA